jgi:hypothetical protein
VTKHISALGMLVTLNSIAVSSINVLGCHRTSEAATYASNAEGPP